MDYRTKPGSPEEVLAHFGVKGQRWGVRKHRDAGHDAAKAAKKIARDKNNSEIDAARARILSGHNRQAFKDAKKEVKNTKGTPQHEAAKRKFNEVKLKNAQDSQKAAQAKSGAETAATILKIVGGTAAAILVVNRAGKIGNRAVTDIGNSVVTSRHI